MIPVGYKETNFSDRQRLTTSKQVRLLPVRYTCPVVFASSTSTLTLSRLLLSRRNCIATFTFLKESSGILWMSFSSISTVDISCKQLKFRVDVNRFLVKLKVVSLVPHNELYSAYTNPLLDMLSVSRTGKSASELLIWRITLPLRSRCIRVSLIHIKFATSLNWLCLSIRVYMLVPQNAASSTYCRVVFSL